MAAALLLVASCAHAQATARSQLLPLLPRWSVELSAPPAGPPVITAHVIVVPLHDAGIEALRMVDGTRAWRADLSAEPPISADDERAYIVSRGAMHALDLATGATAWRVETGMLTAPPLVHAGWVVVAAVGTVAAFRASDGATMWRRDIGTIESHPAIDGDLLFLPLLEGGLTALNLQTGETRWETPLGGAPGDPLAVGGKVYAAARDKRFYALDAGDGSVEWQRRVGAAPRGRAAADRDHVYFVALDNVLRALDRGHGAIEWTTELAYRPASGPVLIGTAVIVPGAVTSLPVFGRDGASLTPVAFPARLVEMTTVVPGPFDHPMVGVVTGDLQHPWTFWLLETSLEPPALTIAPLTALPGETIAFVLPKSASRARPRPPPSTAARLP